MENETNLGALDYQILKHLLAGKDIQFVSNDASRVEEVYAKLKNGPFAELVLNPQSKAHEEIFRVYQEDASYEDYLLIRQYVFYYNRLNQLLNQCNKPVFGELNWPQLAEKAIRAQFDYSKEFLTSQLRIHDFAFNRKEYYRIRGRVDSFSTLFSSSFLLTDANNLFHNDVYRYATQSESESYLTNALESFSSRVYELMNQYVECFGMLRNEFQMEFLGKIDAIHRKVTAFRFLLDVQGNDKKDSTTNSLFTFSRKKTYKNNEQVFEDWTKLLEDLKELDLNYSSFKPENNADFKKIIKQIDVDLDLLRTKKESAFDHYMKRLNAKSSTNHSLQSIEQKLDHLIQQINDAKIFQEQIENHSISSLKKFELLKDLQILIFKAQDQLSRFEGYYDWKSAMILLDVKIQKMLEVLVYVKPKNWVKAFDAWYLSKVAELTMPKDFSSWKAIYSEWKILQEKVKFDAYQALVASRIVDRVRHFQQHKNLHSSLYQQLKAAQSNESMDFESDDLKAEYDNLLRRFFPVQIKSASSSGLNSNSHDLESILKQDLNPTKSQWLNRNIQLSALATSLELNSGNKLHHAESLATLFLRNNPKMKCYVSKNAKYIVQLSEWKSDYFKTILRSESLKKIHITDNPKERVTEFFLRDEIPTYFIYEDFVSGTFFFDSFLNQKTLTDVCNQHGITIIALDSYHFLYNESKLHKKLQSLYGNS